MNFELHIFLAFGRLVGGTVSNTLCLVVDLNGLVVVDRPMCLDHQSIDGGTDEQLPD